MNPRLIHSLFLTVAATLAAAAHADEPSRPDVCTAYAEQLLSKAGLTDQVKLVLDSQIGGREAFMISSTGKALNLTAGGPAGVLYGVQEILKRKAGGKPLHGLSMQDSPDFGLRGNALFLMKDASYNFQLTPKEFPWFYDRPLLTRYLDYLCTNRFNAIFLWSGV